MNYALLIGINYIGTENELSGCINDVLEMKKVLIRSYNYKPHNIKVLRDNDKKNLPTRANIINQLKNVIKNSGKYMQIFIHYSGHGSYILGTEKDGHDEVIVPLDFKTKGFIVDNELNTIIRATKCQTRLVIDSCNSGTSIDLKYTMKLNGQLQPVYGTEPDSIIINKDIMSISGCTDSQTSSDIYSTYFKKPMGALTSNLLQVLIEKRYQNITHKVLMQNLYLKLGKYTQKPTLSSSKEITLDQKFFIKQTRKRKIIKKKKKVKKQIKKRKIIKRNIKVKLTKNINKKNIKQIKINKNKKYIFYTFIRF